MHFRLCFGAFRTSPSAILCVLANKPPLYIRRKKLSIQYSLKLSLSTHNPTYGTVFNCKFIDLSDRNPNEIPPLGVRIQPSCWFCKSQCRAIFSLCYSSVVAQTTPINFTLQQSLKQDSSTEIYKNKFFKMCDHYKGFSRL